MFRDRTDAGRQLGELVAARLAGRDPEGAAVVVGLPRGGVPVAVEVARALGTPVDIILVRKLGSPWQPELAMGAIGEDGAVVLNPDVMRHHGITGEQLAEVERVERAELDRRARALRGGRPPRTIADRIVIVVDDGVATGATARAACHVARARRAARVILAVPVAPPGWADDLGDAADEYLAIETPAGFAAVGAHYRNFDQLDDDDVLELLAAVEHDD